MVYESGFTTRRTYSTRPVVTSYAVSKITSIDWNKHPFVPRPTLIADPITAFGSVNRTRDFMKSTSFLNPLNRASIKPKYDKIVQPVMNYVPVRDRNRERILKMVHQHTANVEAGANGTARQYRDNIDTCLPRIHRAVSETSPVKREILRNEKSGATTPRLDLCTERPGQHRSRGSSDYSYSYKSTTEKNAIDTNNPYSRPDRSTYTSTVESSSRSGPSGSYNYTTERTSNMGSGPGGYSYSSTTSGVLPGGTKYRHFSYRV